MVFWATGDDWSAWVLAVQRTDYSGLGPYAAAYTSYPNIEITGDWDTGGATIPTPVLVSIPG